MYADEAVVLELTALLKAHGVRNIVISPGSRHYAFTRTFEADQDFSLHSVVDERSAAFFALGLVQATGAPAAMICTSGTAAVNYGSALAEANAQNLPLVAITTDRLPEFLGQMEDQMVDQRGLFGGSVRFTAELRPITNERDRWYCNRVINEALIAARWGGGGPVHLNVPIASHSGVSFSVPRLPSVRVITRHRLEDEATDWHSLANRLARRRVLLVWGQGARPSERTRTAVARFLASFDAAVIADHLANLDVEGRVGNPMAFLRVANAHPGLTPEVVITMGGNIVYKDELKGFLNRSKHEHWRVDADGAVADPFRTLTDVIPCRPEHFLERIVTANEERPAGGAYANRMRSASGSLPAPASKHGELEAVGRLMAALPPSSSLHIANSAAIRMTQLHPLDPSIDVFANRGVNGIDGCLSTAIGYAAATDEPTFVIIGDLAFFYDMNSLGVRDLPRNLRILLLNNDGGAVMHLPLPADYSPTAGRHVSAEHGRSARGWVESVGLGYARADTSESTTAGIEWLADPSAAGPRVLEVFSDKLDDVAQLKGYYASLAGGGARPTVYWRVRRFGGRILRRLGLR